MVVIGIDPGLAIVGFGVIKSDRYGEYEVIDYGVIETPKQDSVPTRLMKIYEAMNILIDKYKPDALAIEELFFNKNITTAIPVAEARGVILLAAKQKLGKMYEYTPLQIKQALTGQGRAEKAQVQFMVKAILGLKEVPKPDDAADAVAVAICHLQTNNELNNNMI